MSDKDQRRLWILSQINKHGYVTQEAIKNKFPPGNAQSIIDDSAYFKKHHGITLDKIPTKKDGRMYILYPSGDGEFDVLQRLQIAQEAKRKISKIAFDLVKGYSKETNKKQLIALRKYLTEALETEKQRHFESEQAYLDSPNQDESTQEDSSFDCNENYDLLEKRTKRFISKLTKFWEKRNRALALGAGTTNLKIANLIRTQELPADNLVLSHLNVTTNYLPIFSRLGSRASSVQTRIVGGMHVGSTHAIAGFESAVFLRSLPSLHFGMCIVSTTGICEKSFFPFASSYEESELKSIFMERSVIKILAADDSKFFGEDQMRAGTPFSNLGDLDLIITNRRKTKDGQDCPVFSAIISNLRRKGVPILTC